MLEILNVTNLSKHCCKRKVFDNISFSLEQGEIVGVSGDSGSGKSALLEIIAGYSSQSDGSITFNGFEVNCDMVDYKAKIGYLPQTEALYNDMMVCSFIFFVCGLKKVKNDVKTHANDILDLLILSEKKDSLIKNLSKDEKKKLGLAAALIGNPDILVLDEPLAGISAETQDQIIKVIKELSKTVIISFNSASAQNIFEICGRIVEMSTLEDLNEDVAPVVIEEAVLAEETEELLEEQANEILEEAAEVSAEADELSENQANEETLEEEVLDDVNKLEGENE